MVVKIVPGGDRHPLATPLIGGQNLGQENYPWEDYKHGYMSLFKRNIQAYLKN